MKSYDTFSALEENIRQRLNSADPTESYVAQLAHKGLDSILKKVGEEATEVVIAAKGQDREQTIYEVADLWFHTMVLLGQQSIALDDVANELARRMGQSGLAEKAQRSS